MDTLLVRLKPFEPRRGHVLRRFTYAGIKIHEERGWYRVTKDVAAYLRTVHQIPGDDYTPLAFDVCTDEEAKALDTREETDARVRRSATDEVQLTPARAPSSFALTTSDLADAPARAPGRVDDPRGKKERG